MTWITKIALKKLWLTTLVAAIIAGASVWAMLTLNTELIPDIELPMTTVITFYPGAQPDEVVEKVTIPIEGTIEGISGFKHVSSTSSEGSSVVFFQFEFGTDMDKVNSIIAANLARLDLPAEVRSLPDIMPELGDNPKLWPINMDLLPVVTLSLNGDIPDEELMQTALTQVVPEFEEIDGVLSVSVEGGSGDKVLVNPNLDKMVDYNISIAQLATVLSMQSYGSQKSDWKVICRPDRPGLPGGSSFC